MVEVGVSGEGGQEGGLADAGDAGDDDGSAAGLAPGGLFGHQALEEALLGAGDERGRQRRGRLREGLRLPLEPPFPEGPFVSRGFVLVQDVPDVLPGPAEGGDAVQGLGNSPVLSRPAAQGDEGFHQMFRSGGFPSGQPVGDGTDVHTGPIGQGLQAVAGSFQPAGQRLAGQVVSLEEGLRGSVRSNFLFPGSTLGLSEPMPL